MAEKEENGAVCLDLEASLVNVLLLFADLDSSGMGNEKKTLLVVELLSIFDERTSSGEV